MVKLQDSITFDPKWIWLSLSSELKKDGGNPSHLLELFADAIEGEVWIEQGLTFREFITDPFPKGIGTTEEQVKAIIRLKHKFEDSEPDKSRMRNMREQVGRLLDGELGDHGDNQHSSSVTELHRVKDDGDTPYIRARLKRDEPHLYEQVANGTLTAAAAGRKAGFIKKRQTFVVGDVEQTSRQLKKYFAPNQIKSLIILLQEPS